jgi:hypothetical protein
MRTTGTKSGTVSEDKISDSLAESDLCVQFYMGERSVRKLVTIGALASLAVFLAVGGAGASTPGGDVRLTNDCHPLAGCGAGYVSAYTLATGNAYTDQTLDECTISRGRQNEPAVAVDPRNTSLLLGSSNDYCPVYNQGIAAGAVGPIWLGYYRSLDGGSSWTSSLVPGYPDDTSPYTALSQARTATAGDPVIAWDAHGRAFFGSESSNNIPSITKTQGDVWVARFRNPGGADAADTTKDGLEYYGTTVVASGSSAPNLLGVFHDKTAMRRQRLLLVVALQRERGERCVLRAVDRPRRDLQLADEADIVAQEHPVPGHRGDP